MGPFGYARKDFNGSARMSMVISSGLLFLSHSRGLLFVNEGTERFVNFKINI